MEIVKCEHWPTRYPFLTFTIPSLFLMPSLFHSLLPPSRILSLLLASSFSFTIFLPSTLCFRFILRFIYAFYVRFHILLLLCILSNVCI